MSTTYSPSPKSGYLPFVITNNSTLPDSDIYVTFEGKYKDPGGDLFFFSLSDKTSPPNGVYAPVKPADDTFSANYSYQLSTLAKSSTGANDYLVYIPSSPSNRFFFSVQNPIYLDSNASPNSINAPTYYAFYDPNYNNLFETVELGFILGGGSSTPGEISWTASVNTTEVDAFCIPTRIQYQTYNPADPSAVTLLVQTTNVLPSGFGVGGPSGVTTRDTILTSVVNELTSGDLTGQTPKIWPKLAIPFYSDPYAPSGLQTYLRVLSPKQSVGNDPAPPEVGNLTPPHVPAVQPGPTQFFNYNYPPFPLDYLQSTSYGSADTFADESFANYTSGTSLYISTGGGTPTIYQGVTTGTTPTQVLTFTGISGPNTGQINTLNESDINTFNMYSGSQLMTGGSDADLLGFYFGDAFTVGFIGGTVGTANTGPPPNSAIDITDATVWEPYYVPTYYTNQYSFSGGPWFDLYAKSMHDAAVRNSSPSFLNDVGLCYAYDFDDSLGISGTITPANPTSSSLSPYGSITLGAIDTTIPDPYSDSNTYDVTFTFSPGRTLEYAQGAGPYTPLTSGDTITGLTSNKTNPLKLHFTNGQGPTGDHYFTVYLYYQFIQPLVVYNTSTVAIVNATTITPNSATPTAFTVDVNP